MCDLLSDMSETSLFDFTTKSIKSDKLAWTKIYSQTISHLGLAAKTQPLPTNTNRVSRILSSYTFVVIMKLIYCSSTISRQGQREVRSKQALQQQLQQKQKDLHLQKKLQQKKVQVAKASANGPQQKRDQDEKLKGIYQVLNHR